MSFYAQAHELLARREAGASLDELVAETGWQRASLVSVLSRARKGVLKQAKGGIRKDGWSPEAEQALREHWHQESSVVLAERIEALRPGTTRHAVNARARRLGLRKSNQFGNWREWR